MAELASLMDEFGLEKAAWTTADGHVAFNRSAPTPAPGVVVAPPDAATASSTSPVASAPLPASPAAPKGLPVSSPMIGIFYATSSPGTPPFVSVGDTVAAGQVVGLIEAMKVFNEITAPVAGTVTEVLAESGQLVQPGEPLLYIA